MITVQQQQQQQQQQGTTENSPTAHTLIGGTKYLTWEMTLHVP
jgi:hypothetical protein